MLQQQREQLAERVKAHGQAVHERLGQQVLQAQMLLKSRQASLQQAETELMRGRKLQELGIIAQAELEVLQSRRNVAASEAAAQQAESYALQSSEAASARGLLTELGTSNDVASSQQRLDDITLQLAEVRRKGAILSARAKAINTEVVSGENQSRLLREADLIAPISGEVWRLGAAEGEHVEGGTTVAEVVNCRESFILVMVPQERLPEIEIGAQARFRFSGESMERTGTVTAISGSEDDSEQQKLAARPFRQPSEGLATVRVGFQQPPKSDVCSVGRTAQVIITKAGGGIFAHLLH